MMTLGFGGRFERFSYWNKWEMCEFDNWGECKGMVGDDVSP